MLGSGGSFSVASFAALLHQLKTGRLATASTPLDYMTLPLRDAAVMCFTASGRNKDAAGLRRGSPTRGQALAGSCDARPITITRARCALPVQQIVSMSSEHLEDGFLAVASLLGSSVLLLQACLASWRWYAASTLARDIHAIAHEYPARPNYPSCPFGVRHAGQPAFFIRSSALRPAAVDINPASSRPLLATYRRRICAISDTAGTIGSRSGQTRPGTRPHR